MPLLYAMVFVSGTADRSMTFACWPNLRNSTLVCRDICSESNPLLRTVDPLSFGDPGSFYHWSKATPNHKKIDLRIILSRQATYARDRYAMCAFRNRLTWLKTCPDVVKVVSKDFSSSN
jgi:hypothetical protein